MGCGLYLTYSYNDAGQLTGIYENDATAVATYAYDSAGNVTTPNQTSGYATTASLDAKGRLGTLTHAAPGSAGTVTLGYTAADQIRSRTQSNAA